MTKSLKRLDNVRFRLCLLGQRLIPLPVQFLPFRFGQRKALFLPVFFQNRKRVKIIPRQIGKQQMKPNPEKIPQPIHRKTSCRLVAALQVLVGQTRSPVENLPYFQLPEMKQGFSQVKQNRLNHPTFQIVHLSGGSELPNIWRTHVCISSSEMADMRSALYSSSILFLMVSTRGSCLEISI